MTANQVIAIAAIVLPVATAFLVGYWHRKQMRQIEAFRHNPAAGLIPPRSPAYAFVLAYRVLLVGLTVPGAVLVGELASHSPVTRGSVLRIALGIAAMLFALLLHFIERILRMLDKMTDIMAHLLEASDKDRDA